MYINFTLTLFVTGIILIFKKIIDKIIKNKFNTEIYKCENQGHKLFRSIFCFFISLLSMIFTIIYWKHLISNPLKPTLMSDIINQLMLSYMIIDTLYILKDISNNNYHLVRWELLIHHLTCLFIFGLFSDKSILTFCSVAEILSAYNWVGILFPKYEWTIKIFRLYAIIFIRFFIWIFAIIFLHGNKNFYYFGLFLISIFIFLDVYWTWVIISNYVKIIMSNYTLK